ncbi:MAG: ABC transporter permease [Thermomicrobiales bacterium]
MIKGARLPIGWSRRDARQTKGQEPFRGAIERGKGRPERRALRRLLRNRPAMVGAVLIIGLAFISILAPVLAPYTPTEVDLRAIYHGPSAKHVLGADALGRDILSRILYGTRTSLAIAVIGVAIALILGLLVGPLAGFYGGWLDRIAMRVMDVLAAFPTIILAIIVIAILGPSLRTTMLAIGISSVPTFARLARASTLTLRNEEFVIAAAALGATDLRILCTHIVPNLLTSLIIQSTLRLSTMVLTAAGLSFIGLGVQPPNPELGTMMSEAREALQQAPHAIAFPGLVLMLIVLGFNLFGDGLRDALDPQDFAS